MKTIQYTNWSTQLFDGFYDSMLWSSDSVFYLSEGEPEPPAGFYYDLRDFDGYMKEVAEHAVNLIDSEFSTSWYNENKIIYGVRFLGISSPQYYNFTTDKLEMEVDVDYERLKKFCLETNRKEFDEYLHENFTSCDGFISFVDNSVQEFESNLETESDKYDQVMLEFYILSQDYFKEGNCDWSDYKSDLYEPLDEMQWERLCLCSEKDGKYYDYTLSDDGESVIIGKEIRDEN